MCSSSMTKVVSARTGTYASRCGAAPATPINGFSDKPPARGYGRRENRRIARRLHGTARYAHYWTSWVGVLRAAVDDAHRHAKPRPLPRASSQHAISNPATCRGEGSDSRTNQGVGAEKTYYTETESAATQFFQSTGPKRSGYSHRDSSPRTSGMDLGKILVLDGLQRPSRKCLEPRRTARQHHVVLAAREWRIFSAAVLGEFSQGFRSKLRASMHPDRLQPFRRCKSEMLRELGSSSDILSVIYWNEPCQR